jgi:hypothetical protein
MEVRGSVAICDSRAASDAAPAFTLRVYATVAISWLQVSGQRQPDARGGKVQTAPFRGERLRRMRVPLRRVVVVLAPSMMGCIPDLGLSVQLVVLAARARCRRALAVLPQAFIEHQRRVPACDASKNRALQVSDAQMRARDRSGLPSIVAASAAMTCRAWRIGSSGGRGLSVVFPPSLVSW